MIPSFRIEETDDPRIVTVSIDVVDVPKGEGLNETEAVRLVLDALAAGTASPTAAEALRLVETTGSLREVFEAVATADHVAAELQAAFHLQWTVLSHRIREAVNDDVALTRILRRALPPYEGTGLTVYRGEQAQRAADGRIGFNWAVDRKVAEMFAGGLCTLYPGGGVLLRAIAPADALISGSSPHSTYLGEHELVVDPARLTEVTELARFPARSA